MLVAKWGVLDASRRTRVTVTSKHDSTEVFVTLSKKGQSRSERVDRYSRSRRNTGKLSRLFIGGTFSMHAKQLLYHTLPTTGSRYILYISPAHEMAAMLGFWVICKRSVNE